MRDIGLQRRKQKKKPNATFELEYAAARNATQGSDITATLLPAIGGGSIHTFFHLPVELDEVGKELLANIWTSDDSVSRQTAHRQDWFTVSLVDEATFYQVLSNSELHLSTIRHPHQSKQIRETPISLKYHQKAVSIQRKRPANLAVTHVTEEMIGTASGLVVYADISGYHEWWLPQRKGMVDLIQAFAGGLEALERNKTLRAACSWVEVRVAFMQDLPCLLPLPHEWEVEYGRSIIDSDTAAWAVDDPTLRMTFAAFVGHFDWLDTFDALTRLAKKVGERVCAGRTQGDDVLMWTNSIAHRLLSMQCRDDFGSEENKRPILEICRLTMLLFLASIYRHYGAHPTNSRLLLSRQRQLLSSIALDWTGMQKGRSWAELVAFVETAENDNKALAQHRTLLHGSHVVQALLSSPQDLATAKQVLWLPELLDSKLEHAVNGTAKAAIANQ
ncbi:hypothetical protein Slin15195_G009990 [Septoria linicola]|uniref:Uncharacterized protein n=1 Tax=Septoria linicola TaxID=215465 RepID=A0A9Q9AJP3_9PEZI|nr:hypothetical protein Slin14017_G010000 [Septoria linicola]USW47680.1 hypothetical protein Slin15195_G009990 [Septoria linicola]